MPKQETEPRALYRVPAGTVYPATPQGFRLAKAKRLDEVDWTVPLDEDVVIPAPYPEIVASWLANGVSVTTDAPAQEVSE